MRIIDLAFKDIAQILRDKRSLLFLVAMPLVFTLFMGSAFKDVANAPDPRLPVGWLNQDPEGVVSQQLYTLLSDSQGLRLVDLPADQLSQAKEQVAKGDLAGLLVVPPDFSRLSLADQPAQIRLIADEYSGRGQAILELVRTPMTKVMSGAEIARLSGAEIARLSGAEIARLSGAEIARLSGAATGSTTPEMETSFTQAMAAWQNLSQTGPQLVAEMATGNPGASQGLNGNPYNQSSPGILVMFAMFGLISSATILVQEHKTRTLQRLLTTSMSRMEIAAGHLLAMFFVVFLQQVVLVIFGQFVLKVDYFRQPLASLLVMVALAAWTAAMGLMIGIFSGDEDQKVVLYAMIAMFVLSAMGGAWFPLEGAGSLFASLGRLTPAAWAMDGFQNLLVRGLGFTSVLLPAAILAAYAVFFFGLALWRFKPEA